VWDIFWSGAKRTASPLTPALSPLRGEGVAFGAPVNSDTLLRGGIASTSNDRF